MPYGLTSRQWIELKRQAKQRDRFQCVCGNRGRDGHGSYLHVDHVVPWEWSKDNSLGNLRTLCLYHHSKIAYRRSRNPLYVITIFELSDSADALVDRGFGVIR